MPMMHQRSRRRTTKSNLIDASAAVFLVNVLQVDHVLAGARRRLELEGNDLAALGRLYPVDLLQLLHPALHLRGMRGARLEALDELDLLGEHRLLALELGLLLLLVLRPLLLVEFIVAGIGRQRARIDLDDLGDDTVHELAVVRGHQQRALVAFQEFLQPDQAFEIQMVARFVEEHDIGAHQQNAGKRHAHLPAARQRTDIAVHHLLAEAQTREHFAGASLERIAVQFLVTRLHLAVALDDLLHAIGLLGIGHGRLQIAQFAGNDADWTGAVHHLGDGAVARHLADILVEIADGDTPLDGDLPSSGCSSPLIIRKTVVLPAPFGPTRPIFSPLLRAADASMKRIRWLSCLLMFSIRIMICAAPGEGDFGALMPCGETAG